ncbi:uncharacterized protein LOC129252898 [Anastrepha obliqua]|uniref:uncharacterized protein LOC129252898 n=1 Tax=Anastrepha obliqua TaxID=95512 RepID=UPI002409A70F|nr:uncharacterized protein LOC129252898 [Anastrepha obliqua]
MYNLRVYTLLLALGTSCYVSDSTKATSNDDDFLQAMHLANSPNINSKPYTPIQEQQKQQQRQQHEQHLQHPNKRSLLTPEVATATLKTRQKRSQHGLATSDEYLRNMPTYAYNLALLNIMHSLRKQLSNIELARLRARLGRSAAADLQLFNEIYNNDNNNAALFNDESAALYGDDLGSSSSSNGNGGGVGFAAGASLIGTDTGNGGLGMLGGVADAGANVGAGNGMLVNDIQDLSMPWKFVGRVSKKSSALYKPRLGKRTQEQQQTACN